MESAPHISGAPVRGGRTIWLLLFLLNLAAFADSAWLFHLQDNLAEFTSACRIAPGFDCAPALKSRYGKIMEIPISNYGLAAYAIFAGLAIQGFFKPAMRDRNALLLSLLTGAGSVYCAWLAWISATKLRAYCPYCLVLHVLTPMIFLLSLAAVTRRTRSIGAILGEELATIRADKRLAIGIVVTGVLMIAGIPWLQERIHEAQLDRSPNYRRILEGEYPRMSSLHAQLAYRPFRGSESAPVTIIEFGDFTCAHCREARLLIEDIAEVYDVRYGFVSYPRSLECNPAAADTKPGACLSAQAAEYALPRGKFWETHDALFDDPDLMLKENAARLAAIAGAPSVEALQADTLARFTIMANIQLALQAGAFSTPVIFVNGMGIEGLPPEWFLRRLVEKETERARQAK